MDDAEFDQQVIRAVFEQAALRGWADVSLVEAATEAGLDLGRVRRRFAGKAAVLLRFGAVLDAAALEGAKGPGTAREKLFDILMNRFEGLQAHRDGVLALMAALRTDPATGLLLYGTTLRSMRWLLEGAGFSAAGLTGALRIHGLAAVWAYALRAWERDESADLSGTMAAVDRALDRAAQAERSMPWQPRAAEPGEDASAADDAVKEPVELGDLPGSGPSIM